jgi:cytochrome c553
MKKITTTLLLGLACAASAHALEIDLPQETAVYKESTLPGYQLALAQCLMCHSAQYVQYQPRTSPRGYWEATVKKMKTPFGAPFPEADIAPIVDYLTKTYGAEAPR